MVYKAESRVWIENYALLLSAQNIIIIINAILNINLNYLTFIFLVFIIVQFTYIKHITITLYFKHTLFILL